MSVRGAQQLTKSAANSRVAAAWLNSKRAFGQTSTHAMPPGTNKASKSLRQSKNVQGRISSDASNSLARSSSGPSMYDAAAHSRRQASPTAAKSEPSLAESAACTRQSMGKKLGKICKNRGWVEKILTSKPGPRLQASALAFPRCSTQNDKKQLRKRQA